MVLHVAVATRGSLPWTLSLLRNLTLHNNTISSSIPPEVGRLRRYYLSSSTILLETFLLLWQILSVRTNFLSGTIPYAFGQLKDLRLLQVGNNSFGGTIPPSIFNLSSLEGLSLSLNNFNGSLPSKLGMFFPNLRYFGIVDNQFTGPIPPSISNASNLKMIVPNLENLRRLEWMSIADNQLGSAREGDLRFISTLTNATNLRNLDASDNKFGGVLPDSITKFRGCLNFIFLIIISLALYLLKFLLYHPCQPSTGVIPLEVRHLKAMNHLDVSQNMLSGVIPSTLGNCLSLEILSMQENFFHGTIPSSFASLRGVRYLKPIVHCDMKPSNVLLDEEMTAQVGDFGLMKFFSEDTDNLPTNQTSSVGVRGTVGYAAPEYGMGSEVSTYGDMYSYGILIVEMFTGKKPIDAVFDDNKNLHNYVKMALPERIAEITDAMLLQEKGGSTEGVEKFNESLLQIFEIGVAWSKETVGGRMNIVEALARLTMIKAVNNK